MTKENPLNRKIKSGKLLFLLTALLMVTSVKAQLHHSGTIPDNTLPVENIFPFQEQHCHGSTIVELPNRDLLVAWFQGSGERTADDVGIRGARYNHRPCCVF